MMAVQRLALFDLDNTLVDLGEAFRTWAAEFADGYGLGREGVDRLIALDQEGYPHREVFFGKVRERFALPETADELWSRYRQRMPYLVRCRPEVMDGLARLRAAGWKVAIVTNGTADNQLGKLQRTGLAEAVDAYALSGLEGIRKPDVGLFEIAARRCGMSLAGGGWMVGDHPVKDIGGGRAAGLRTVWVQREARLEQEHGADHVVTDVLQAMEVLHGERRSSRGDL
ncbi:haloacid dehalogenase [Planomonospora parontospora subsp. antibiotica]|nr:haloacid dehalogenase [Planomonospora parontospora subsp. antibiotica]GII19517.1 haloacid dehalogenase [Planomonospora parontospora subsp. antibiotica]